LFQLPNLAQLFVGYGGNMEAMRESWTDERLDDFRSHVDQRFDQVDQRFDQVDQRFDRVEAELRAQRLETRTEFTALRGDFESLRRLIIQVGGGMFGTLALGIITVLATR
jgi:hypothetical protein